ncbi:glycosyltransferase family 2 protein [Spongiibacter sp. KMU-166]|uniref:Glycosyltransferase family 2 protein n=1 Tax=Spongiibacter thalassae TaxID=2721624 RepID=A0ABX1GJI7_9GAMM|nr:glycosyltransferase family 2 protein [Spongiibacter thalassae]NKI19136.1 glycosyltransferase family 2 protein [Spongiibacter thalassae]
MTKRLVSVAMCTYNGEAYLEEQLDSILAQTYRDIEVVVFDDCSSDGTMAILNRYSRRDDRVRVHRNECNVGFVRNFEKAISACRGEFISLADQDDIWFENKIEHLLGEIGSNLMVYSNVSVVDAGGRPLDVEFPGRKVRRLEGDCALALLFTNCVTGHASVIRRELFDLAHHSLAKMKYHDQWLAIAAASKGRLKACDAVLSLYRSHGNNVVYGRSSGKKKSRHDRYMDRQLEHLQTISVVINSGLLRESDQKLVTELKELYQRNTSTFINWKLRSFLLHHKQKFLPIYKNEEKIAKRLSRGRWYYILLPFA